MSHVAWTSLQSVALRTAGMCLLLCVDCPSCAVSFLFIILCCLLLNVFCVVLESGSCRIDLSVFHIVFFIPSISALLYSIVTFLAMCVAGGAAVARIHQCLG